MVYYPASKAAVYMANPLSVTPSVVMTAEACTNAGDNVTFYITNAAHGVIDDTSAVTVKANGVTKTLGTDYSIYPAAGKVIFVSPPATPVTIDGKYLPVAAIAQCSGATFTQTSDIVDVTPIDSLYKQYVGLLDDGTITFDRWMPNSGTIANDAALETYVGKRVVVILYPSDVGVHRVAGFGYIKQNTLKAQKGAVISETLSIQCDGGLFSA